MRSGPSSRLAKVTQGSPTPPTSFAFVVGRAAPRRGRRGPGHGLELEHRRDRDVVVQEGRMDAMEAEVGAHGRSRDEVRYPSGTARSVRRAAPRVARTRSAQEGRVGAREASRSFTISGL